MRYVDTSVLLALFLNEAKTPDAWQWLKNLQGSPLYVSYWTFTEFSSALGVRARMRLLDEPGRLQVIEDLRKLALARLVCVDCIPEDFQQAAALCDQWKLGLRAGDALHLAITQRFGWILSTLDIPLIEAARKLGLNVETF